MESETQPADNLVAEPMWKDVRGWLNTGCTVLNLAMSGRCLDGFPMGRIVHIFGAEASCKTVLAMEACGDTMRKGGVAHYRDAERTFDPRFARLFGVNPDDRVHFDYSVPESLEDLFDDKIRNVIRAVDENNAQHDNIDVAEATVNKSRKMPEDEKAAKLAALANNRAALLPRECAHTIVADTLTVLPSEKMEGDKLLTDGASRGAQAIPVGTGFRRYAGLLNDRDITFIVINQARTNPDIKHGDKDTVSGGRAIWFYSSVIIKMQAGEWLKNKNDVVTGVRMYFEVTKNKVAPPMREGSFRILFDYGIDNIASNLDFLIARKTGLVKESGAGWYEWHDLKAQGIEALTHKIEDAQLEFDLEDEVARVWAEVHKPVERAEKRRR